MVPWLPEIIGQRRSLAVFGLLLAGTFLPQSNPFLAARAAPARGSDTVTCSQLQQARVSEQAPWRCEVLLEPDKSYLARVDRQNIDVTLEIVAPDARRPLKVDSPTRRAGPELLFFRASARGKHSIVLRTVERGVSSAVVEVQLRELPEAPPGTPLARGLAALTSSASYSQKNGTDDAQRRIALLRAALPDLAAAGAPELEAETLFRIAAMHYWLLLDWAGAASAAQDAVDAFNRLADPIMASQAAVIRAASLIEIPANAGPPGARAVPKARDARFDEAERLFTASADQFRTAGMRYDEAYAINYLGVAYQYRGRVDEARACFLEAARIYREIGERASETLPLQNVAVLDYERGDYAAAVASYHQLLPRLDPENDRSDYVAILNNLGSAQYVLGNTDEALDALLNALRLLEAGGDYTDRARTLHALGRTYEILGEEERAAVFLEQSLALRRSGVSDRRGLLISLLRNGDLNRDRHELDRAVKLHLEALDQAVSPQERTKVLLAIGQDQMTGGTPNAAAETYERALKLELPEDWPVRVSVRGAYGYALMRTGNTEGRAHLAKAAQAHEAAGDDELAAQDYYLLASEDRRAGQFDSALRNVDKSLALYESQRIRALNPDLRATYVSTRAGAYELQADIYMLLAERAPTPAEQDRLQSVALFAAERLRVRALNDFRQFAQSRSAGEDASSANMVLELDSRLAAKRHRLAAVMDQQNPSAERIASLRRDIALLRTELDVALAKQRQRDSGSEVSPGPSSLDELQRSVAADSIILTWLLGEDRSWVWCVTRTGATAYPLAGRSEVERAARDLHALWSRPSTANVDDEREQEASRQILGSAGKLLAGKREVVVVADGVLRAIPIGALWVTGTDGYTSTRIAETHDVSYRPSLNRWNVSRTTTPEPQTGRRILLVGDPVLFGDSGVSDEAMPSRETAQGVPGGGFSRLPGSRREIAGIVQIATGWHSDVLMGDRATKAAVLAEPLGRFRVLHFATHARLDVHDPQLSAIVLSGPRVQYAADRSALSLREIVGLELNADTVVLSACEGSLGKEYRGQLSFGLSEAFLLAGSRNVLGSLWRVSDVATERYMRSFYDEYLRRGLSSARAAQAAARSMMRDPTFSHPYFWAAFVTLAG